MALNFSEPDQQARFENSIKEFINTGTSNLGLLMDAKGRLCAFQCGTLLFIVGKRQLATTKNMPEWLIAALKSLAEREGLEFRLQESLQLKNLRAETIRYWPWKHQPEIDDSELINATKVGSPSPELTEADWVSTYVSVNSISINLSDTPF